MVPWEDLEWRRVSEIEELNNPDNGPLEVFSKGIEPNDIKQGKLGDCYLLAALSVLAEKPQRIKNLFILDKINEQGVFAVRFYKNGKMRNIVLDDYIPCNKQTGELVFAKGSGNELWVILLEKAFAKLHGSYERIADGKPFLTMRDLTGAPGYRMSTEKTEDLEHKMLSYQNSGYLMCCIRSSKEAQAKDE